MQYIEWCGRFLSELSQMLQTDPQSRSYTNLALLAQRMFKLEPTEGYGGETRLSAMHTAARDLQTLGLTVNQGNNELWGLTNEGERYAGRLSLLSPQPRQPALAAPDHRAIVHTINRLSPQDGGDHAWPEPIETPTVIAESGWKDSPKVFDGAVTTLELHGLIERVGRSRLRATYRGLIWGLNH